jgi:PHD/YefM family antitoxin component YafN of YafNO toxin-antitoxin module
MTTHDVSEVAQNLEHILHLAQTEEVFIERSGSPVAVMLHPDVYEKLMDAFEDLEDIKAVAEAIAVGEAQIPLEKRINISSSSDAEAIQQAKRDLGLTD